MLGNGYVWCTWFVEKDVFVANKLTRAYLLKVGKGVGTLVFWLDQTGTRTKSEVHIYATLSPYWGYY